MDITRRMIDNKEHCKVLVEMMLDEIGIGEEEIGNEEIRAATEEFAIETLRGYLDITSESILTEYYENMWLSAGAFAEGYEACLKKQLALRPA